MKKRTVVLAPPYSGTLYAWFHDCLADREYYKGHESWMDNSYYADLYSQYTEQTKHVAIMFSVLYDYIILPPADAFQPREDKANLGFQTKWDEFDEWHQMEKITKHYTNNPKLVRLLRTKEPWHVEELLAELRYCIRKSRELNCPIFCGQGTQQIINLMNRIDEENISKDTSNQIQFVENYLNLSGFMFNVNDLDILGVIKSDSKIRRYCNQFAKILEKRMDSSTTEADLKKLILESINQDDISKHIRGVLNISSLLLSIVGLVPVIGTPLSVASLTSTGIEKGLSISAPNWYELAPRVEMMSKEVFLKKSIKNNLIL